MYKIYGKPNCKFCDMAKTLLEMKGIEFQYIDLHQNEEAMNFILSKGFRQVPQIYLDDEHIGGFTELKARVE